ncbi:MAG TPA: glycosyltransferase family 4 protein [Kofleriaceae bacterium]|nr:glycosyltransferase family 4 protein [Kofleriaceae bacterium]
MTRVLMTADTVRGVWTYACELVTALAPCGVEVTLATMGRALSPVQARRAAPIGNLEIVESSYALEWMPEPWADVDAAGEWLLELAARVQPDLVHINGYAHAALPFGVPVVCVAHSCLWTWMRAVRGHDPGPSFREYFRRVRAGLTKADVVVAPTTAILRAILEAYAVHPRCRVIPNGCAATGWRPGGKADVVLTAGRLWDEAKGLADLSACARDVAWPIVVAGATTPPGGAAAVEARGLHLLGELPPDQLAAWMSRASIYALPARYEPFGLSVLEAALAGCTLVLGDIATLREVWGDTAVYVPPGDPEALGFALNALARDPLGRGVHAARSRARARTLSPARMAAAYRALYDEVIAGRSARQEISA